MVFTKSLSDLHKQDIEDRKRWLLERQTGIGASETAGILNVSPFATPLSVYADKIAPTPKELDDATIERFRWGHILERVILDELSARTDLTFRRAPQHRVVRHSEFPLVPMFATPDAYVLEESRRLCQIKTSSQFADAQWRDGVPLHVNVQVQSEMAVCDREAVIVVVLIGGQKLLAFNVERHQKFIEQLQPSVSEFWFDHVVPKVLPAVDAASASIHALERLHPDDDGEEVVLPDRALAIDAQLKDIREDLAVLQADKKALEAEIKSMLGPHTWGRLPDGSGRWSWKTIERRAYEAKASKYRQLRRGK